MSKLECKTEKITDQEVRLSFAGAIDEDAQFTLSDLKEGTHLRLNFKGIQGLNSCGIREWIRFLNKIPSSLKLSFEECPKIVIDQVNMVAGFLPAHAQVLSFYVPYFCEACDEVASALLESPKDFEGNLVKKQEAPSCVKCKAVMELDVIPANYFKFLKNPE